MCETEECKWCGEECQEDDGEWIVNSFFCDDCAGDVEYLCCYRCGFEDAVHRSDNSEVWGFDTYSTLCPDCNEEYDLIKKIEMDGP